MERPTVARRVTVGLIRKTSDEIDALSARTGMTSTDLVNRAISLLAFVDEQGRAGRELCVADLQTGEVSRLHML